MKQEQRVRIVVDYSAALSLPRCPRGGHLELPEAATVENALERCGLSGEQRRFLVPSVNGQRCPLSRRLRQGDRLALFLPLSGG